MYSSQLILTLQTDQEMEDGDENDQNDDYDVKVY